ncbi:chemotaxis protein [Campylobacter gastrosuis]|uniref:Chemotaxis protein n=1 Tax=Campylobacter gastrosuis TaxID=2974576 RepID=A0ABT7HRR9_9BACT|nr:chemotaxis protein [Campylobacter gastrosuis]MDL0089591.1 chemotaxis protein [Campylobacter gastrosuis]
MLKVKIIYKFSIIILLVLAILTLLISRLNFINENYTQNLLNAHKIAGITLFLIAFLHIILKRKKLIKLTNEFLDIILKRKNPSFCNMERLVNALEHHTLKSLSVAFDINLKLLLNTIKNEGVKFNDEYQTLRKIAKLNDKNIFFVIVLIIETKLNKS